MLVYCGPSGAIWVSRYIYLKNSMQMWTTVKSSYPDMTVCEIGATIGRLWRELTNEQKEKYNEDFMRDKVCCVNSVGEIQ